MKVVWQNNQVKNAEVLLNRINFSVPESGENETVEIDLGNLTAMTKVSVNGTYAGRVWTYLYNTQSPLQPLGLFGPVTVQSVKY